MMNLKYYFHIQLKHRYSIILSIPFLCIVLIGCKKNDPIIGKWTSYDGLRGNVHFTELDGNVSSYLDDNQMLMAFSQENSNNSFAVNFHGNEQLGKWTPVASTNDNIKAYQLVLDEDLTTINAYIESDDLYVKISSDTTLIFRKD